MNYKLTQAEQELYDTELIELEQGAELTDEQYAAIEFDWSHEVSYCPYSISECNN